MSDTLLLTGGTGFLGMELIARMLEQDEGPDIVLAVRARDEQDVEARLARLVAQLYDTVPASARRLSAVRADLTSPDLGMTAADRRALAERVDRVIHCAASISFTLPLPEAREINVAGTRRMIELARGLPQLERLVHVSTAYVAGRAPGVFRETDAGGSGFRNTYERTKLEAEHAVAGADDLPSVVVRPSIVVGESDSGWTSAFNVLYWPLQAFARGVLDTVPADPNGVVDMVPVDWVADIIERAAFAPGASGRFHAVAGDRAVSVDELIDLVCDELDRPAPALSKPGSLPADHPAGVFAPYFDVKTRFDDRRAALLAGDLGPAPDPPSYLRALLDYGTTARWGKRPLTREAARARVAGPRVPGVR
ncbi:MAG: SDR family oxidoreductase [Thermoleophilaceae bacterium]